MRLRYAFLTLLTFVCAITAHGQRADERYVGIYNLIQQADALAESGRTADAVAAYKNAQEQLLRFQAAFPRWKEKIVKFRLEYIEARLLALGPDVPPESVGSKDTPPPAPEESEPSAAQLAGLQQVIRQLQAENGQLEARLREALAAKPAATDPQELIKARQAARQLEKERDLLLVTLDQARAGTLRMVDPEIAAREQEILASVQRQLAEQVQTSARLRAENEDLKQKLASGGASAPSDVALELQLANAMLAALRSTNIALRTERILLEERLARAATAGDGVSTQELTELKARMALLRARVQVYEAKEVPYTPEELALFKQAPLQATFSAGTKPKEKRSFELPPGAGPLITKARTAIQAGRFEEAEQIYRQILRQDEENVYVLGNLAGVQIDLGQYPEAEATLKKVLKIDPQDASSLFALGMLKYEQGKFDEALDALSLSVQILPDDARSHYYLGKTLVQKGNRTAAETALRRAVQLRPGMSPAHHLLAVVYATQDPPFTELAQWHYQKALDGGYPPDPELEKKIQQQKTTN